MTTFSFWTQIRSACNPPFQSSRWLDSIKLKKCVPVQINRCKLHISPLCVSSRKNNAVACSLNRIQNPTSHLWRRNSWLHEPFVGTNLFIHSKTDLRCRFYSNKSRSTSNSVKVLQDKVSKTKENINQTKEIKKESFVKTKEKVRETVGEIFEFKENVWTIPNALTLSRMVMAPVLGYLVVHESFSLACGVFVAAGVTDMLDGYIARNFKGQSSSFGSYIDPLADKLLVSVLFISLTAVDLIPLALTGLIVTRDLLLIGAAFYVRYISLPPPRTLSRYFDVTKATAEMQPLFISKVNTALQLSLVAFTLAAPVFSYVDHPLLEALWYLTAGTTVASGIGYMFAKDTFKIYRKAKSKQMK